MAQYVNNGFGTVKGKKRQIYWKNICHYDGGLFKKSCDKREKIFKNTLAKVPSRVPLPGDER